MTLQFSQMRRTLARTFMTGSLASNTWGWCAARIPDGGDDSRAALARRRAGARAAEWVGGRSARSIDDAPLGQVVGRHLERHAIPGKDADEVHAHLSRHM